MEDSRTATTEKLEFIQTIVLSECTHYNTSRYPLTKVPWAQQLKLLQRGGTVHLVLVHRDRLLNCWDKNQVKVEPVGNDKPKVA